MTRIVIIASLLVGACGSPAKPAPQPPTPTEPAAADDPTCPLVVPGTSISVEDTAEGPALVFVTTGDVAAVRTRGQALATMHNDRNGPPGSLATMFTAPSTAKASDIEGGVRVTFVPSDLSGQTSVGDELRMHGGHLAGASSCKM